MPDVTCTHSDPVIADGSPVSNPASDSWQFSTTTCEFETYVQDFFNSSPSASLDVSGSTVIAELGTNTASGVSDILKLNFTVNVLILFYLGFSLAVWFFRR